MVIRKKVIATNGRVTFLLSKYDHLDVTGIVEDGVHAKATSL